MDLEAVGAESGRQRTHHAKESRIAGGEHADRPLFSCNLVERGLHVRAQHQPTSALIGRFEMRPAPGHRLEVPAVPGHRLEVTPAADDEGGTLEGLAGRRVAHGSVPLHADDDDAFRCSAAGESGTGRVRLRHGPSPRLPRSPP